MAPSREAELWAAGRIRAMHQLGGRCAQCPDKGECGLLVWAEMQLRLWEHEQGRTYPGQRPGWQVDERVSKLFDRREGS